MMNSCATPEGRVSSQVSLRKEQRTRSGSRQYLLGAAAEGTARSALGAARNARRGSRRAASPGAPAMGKGSAEEAYFQRGSLLWLTVITLSLGYYTWVVFWPQSIPYQSLGPLGLFTQYLVDHHQTLVHNGYKGITNGRARLLWFVQTFFFGIASLSILIAYRPKHKKKT
ncbi:transmembrane protein 254-like isoform X2 [Tenrec ecaudatus]|uniref:transmembrane protein 254-like isoform X2 n=1 Tax=Tenrec ecaudatus TaxID=94439 RepID=UPI003F59826F